MVDSFPARTLRELTRVIFARLGTGLLIIAIISGGTLVACLKAPKYYRSSVTFLAKEPRSQNPAAQQVSSDRSLEVFIKTQHELVKSGTVLARTLLLLSSPDSPAARDWRAAHQAWEAGNSEQHWTALRAALEGLDAEIELRRSVAGSEINEDLRRLARKVKVETPGGEEVAMSEVFTISVTQAAPPVNAQRAAELLGESYKDRYREVQTRSNREATEFVRQRFEELKRDRLIPAEDAVRRFVERDLESPGDLVILEQLSRAGTEAGRQIVVRRFQEELITLEGELAEARQLRQQLIDQLPRALWDAARTGGQKGDLHAPSVEALTSRDREGAVAGNLRVPSVERVAEARLSDSDPILTEAVTIIPEAVLKNNVVVQQLKSKEVALLIELNRLRVEYQPDYRGVRDKLTEVARTRREILRELIGETSALDIKVATLSAREQEIKRRLETEQARLDQITPKLVRYQELQHEVSVAREQHRKLSSDLAAALSSQGQEAGAITLNIVDPAGLPDVNRPAFPNTLLYTLVSVLVGVLLAASYSFIADHFDHTLHSVEEAERYLGVSVIGSIGRLGRGLVT